ncbi:MAG: T9SS C-terminal target domain-containing protein [Methanobacteriota archaeon]|nr:MAG: T9SS C-terminal target domain-containing protein [Euryarchaeota archaeon]
MKKDYHGGFVVLVNGDTTQSRSVVKRFLINGTHLWTRHFDGNLNDLNAVDEHGNIFVSSQNRFKLDLNGNHLWPDTLVGPIPDNLWYDRGGAFPDGMGGVIGVRWNTNNTIKINRADSTGQFVFGNGIFISSPTFSGLGYAPDNAGGIYVNWKNQQKIKIQRITKQGILAFDSTGLNICDGVHCGALQGIVPDGNNGAILFWKDYRNSPMTSFYAQRLDSLGNFLWDTLGILFYISMESSIGGEPIPAYSDGRGGAILAWWDYGINIKQISSNGILGEVISGSGNIREEIKPFSIFQLFQNYPNPFNASTIIEFKLFQSGLVQLKIFNPLGQEVIRLVEKHLSPGNYTIKWDGKDNTGKQVSSGIYFYTFMLNNEIKASKKMIFLK